MVEKVKEIQNKFYVYMYLDQNNIPFYIGKGCGKRFKINIHLSKYHEQPFLQNKIKKVGVDNIKIHFLHESLTEKLSLYWEEYWINYIGRRDKREGTLCNLVDGGKCNSGRIVSLETRKKLSVAMKGKMHSKETKQKMSNTQRGNTHAKGYKHTDDSKCKISIATTGKNNPMYGKHLSAEARRKISEGNKGKIISEERKKAVSMQHKGKKVAEETKRKISESNKKCWAERKSNEGKKNGNHKPTKAKKK